MIASKIDGIPEALDDGVEGLLIPPQDPEALANAILRLELRASTIRLLGSNIEGGRGGGDVEKEAKDWKLGS